MMGICSASCRAPGRLLVLRWDSVLLGHFPDVHFPSCAEQNCNWQPPVCLSAVCMQLAREACMEWAGVGQAPVSTGYTMSSLLAKAGW